MNKSIFLTISLSVLMLLLIYQYIPKQHLLKKITVQNFQFSLMDSAVLSKTDKQSNIDIANYTTGYSTRVSSSSNQNDVTDEPVIEKSSKEMENLSHTLMMSQSINSTTVTTKLDNANWTTVSPDQSFDNLVGGTESDVTTYNEFRADMASSAIDSFSNKTSKFTFSTGTQYSSINSSCQKLLLEYLNVSLDESVLQTLLKKCFGNEKEQTELLLDKQFFRSVEGNVSCPKIKPRFLNKSVPLVALASFPGSGNTWTRVLLERVTGIFTGSLYNDPMAHFVGSRRCPTKAGVIVVKTHKQTDLVKRKRCPTNTKFAQAIFILRNPFDAILAEFNRVKGGKVGFAHQTAYKSDKWRRFVKFSSKRWKDMALFWMTRYKKPVHVLVYEDLKNNTILETYRLANFLHVNVTLQTLYCAVKNPLERYHRAEKPEWMMKSILFDKEMIENINANIRVVRQHFDDIYEKVFKNYYLASK